MLLVPGDGNPTVDVGELLEKIRIPVGTGDGLGDKVGDIPKEREGVALEEREGETLELAEMEEEVVGLGVVLGEGEGVGVKLTEGVGEGRAKVTLVGSDFSPGGPSSARYETTMG